MPEEGETVPTKPGKPTFGNYVNAGLAAIGVIALALSGYLNIMTKGEAECRAELADKRVALASSTTRVEMLTEVKEACEAALAAIMEDGT